MPRTASPHVVLACSLAFAAVLASGAVTTSCSGGGSGDPTSGPGGPGGAGGAGGGGTGGAGGDTLNPPGDTFTDFPDAPVVLDGLPADLPSIFEQAPGSDTGGPCLSEPAIDAMVPKNWTPLLFEWTPPADQNVFEIRLHVENQINDLVVYTSQPTFTIDTQMWKDLTSHSFGRDVVVTLRGARLDNGAITAGPFVGAAGPVHIAPVDAPGSVVYWTSSNGTSFQGFRIGDPASVTVLTPASAGDTSTGGATTCVSCHTSSPDGKLVIYTRDANNGTRSVDARAINGSGPPAANQISPAALALLGRHKQAAPVTSLAHYGPNDAVAITVFQDPSLTAGRYELIWTDLHAADGNGWGILARNGDPRQVASPTWRHDGTEIAYVSSEGAGEGVVSVAGADGVMDIYAVPYNDRVGGDAAPVPGASDPSYHEFYPVYSPNDTLLAFNRAAPPVNSYNQPTAEVLVVPTDGSSPAARLTANDPPACTGLVSPGLTNSWARWSPQAKEYDGKRYYWLVFSSQRRAAIGFRPQLYVAAVVTSVDGQTETLGKDYPAVYVTSQNPNENNHTPAWDVFEVEEVPQ